MRLFAVVLALTATPAVAQTQPQPGAGDPRRQMVVYDPDQIVQLHAAPGYQVSIEFAPDERVETVAVGDSTAWQVTPNKRGDHLFVKAASAGVTTNMTVVTDARMYVFELAPINAPSDMAFTVRFTYPPAKNPPAAVATPVSPGRYQLSGDKALRPSAMDDDGEHTYLEWPADRALPAVFAVDDHGNEVAVDGYMRDGFYTIDAIKPALVFRLDKRVARATRLPPARSKR